VPAGILTATAPGGGIRLILDDGKRVNVLARARMEALALRLAELARPENRPAFVVLEGNGRGSFAAGAHLGEIASLDPAAARELSRLGERVTRWLSRGPWPTGALVDGHALGGGLDLVLACDAAVATRRSRFAHPGLRRGFLTGWGGTARLPRRTGGGGPAAFHRLFLAADEIDADAAEAAGILSGRARTVTAARRLLVDQLRQLAAWPPGLLDAWRAGRACREPGRLCRALGTFSFVDMPRGRC